MTNDLPSYFRASADKPIVELRSNFVGELNMDSSGVINFWSHQAKFPPFPNLRFVEQFLHIDRQTA